MGSLQRWIFVQKLSNCQTGDTANELFSSKKLAENINFSAEMVFVAQKLLFLDQFLTEFFLTDQFCECSFF